MRKLEMSGRNVNPGILLGTVGLGDACVIDFEPADTDTRHRISDVTPRQLRSTSVLRARPSSSATTLTVFRGVALSRVAFGRFSVQSTSVRQNCGLFGPT